MKQVIVIRKDLNMRKGKMVAQGAHASMKAILDEGILDEGIFDDEGLPEGVTPHSLNIELTHEMYKWLSGIFTKICVGVDSEKELLNIYQRAKENGLHCSLIQDAGLTEFNGKLTYTTVAVGPGKPEDIDKITGNLKLL